MKCDDAVADTLELCDERDAAADTLELSPDDRNAAADAKPAQEPPHDDGVREDGASGTGGPHRLAGGPHRPAGAPRCVDKPGHVR